MPEMMNNLIEFPEIKTSDRILILAPHIDDEIVSSAGIIQQANQTDSEILIIYATNGDNSPYALVRKLLKPSWFVSFGKKRMAEARKAIAVLGLKEENLIFLGYPDNGLKQMFNRLIPYTSRSTRLNFNPYQGTYREKQQYTKDNLINDLSEITNSFKPTLAIVPHPKDKHPDHKSLFYYWKEVVVKDKIHPGQYAYLVHFKSFPQKKGLKKDELLQPPEELAFKRNWHSFNLSLDQKEKKMEAVMQNASQLKRFSISNLLKAFIRKNEIFEKTE